MKQARRQLRALRAPLGALPAGTTQRHRQQRPPAAERRPHTCIARRGPNGSSVSPRSGGRSSLGARRLTQPPPHHHNIGATLARQHGTTTGRPAQPTTSPEVARLNQLAPAGLHEPRKRRRISPPAALGGASHMDRIKAASRLHLWHWNEADKSHECIVSEDKLEVCFHPQCSESAAAIRGTEPLTRNGNYYYWEVTVLDRTYGTSIMFGLCTKNQKLHANDYCNLIGLDQEGWSLSHKGLIWHNKKNAQFSQMFPPNQSVTIGLLFNTMLGQLSYFMDGKDLGVAFTGLNDVDSELYPVIGSTAKRTRIRLNGAYCGYISLLERSCFSLLKNCHDKKKLIEYLHTYQLPRNLINYLSEASHVCYGQTKITALCNQNSFNSVDHHQVGHRK